MDWKTEVSFGKHKGKTLLNAWIEDKGYFAWAVGQGLEKKYPELQFLIENTKESEWPN